MKKIIRLTESDLTRLVKRVIREMDEDSMKHIVWDIKAMNCSGMRENKSGQVDVNYNEEDGKAIARIRYCEGDDDDLDYLKRKAIMIIDRENRLIDRGEIN